MANAVPPSASQLTLSREEAARAGGNRTSAKISECQSLPTSAYPKSKRISRMSLNAAPISSAQPKRPGSWKCSASAECKGRCTSMCQIVTQTSDGAGLQLLLPNGYKQTCLKANSPVSWPAPASITKYHRQGWESRQQPICTSHSSGS